MPDPLEGALREALEEIVALDTFDPANHDNLTRYRRAFWRATDIARAALAALPASGPPRQEGRREEHPPLLYVKAFDEGTGWCEGCTPENCTGCYRRATPDEIRAALEADGTVEGEGE